jgi:hypothetical protein
MGERKHHITHNERENIHILIPRVERNHYFVLMGEKKHHITHIKGDNYQKLSKRLREKSYFCPNG